jgi:hypothetical protein
MHQSSRDDTLADVRPTRPSTEDAVSDRLSRSVHTWRSSNGDLAEERNCHQHTWRFRKAEPPRSSSRSRAVLKRGPSWRDDSPARALTSAVVKTTQSASDECPSGALLSCRRRRDADVGHDARCRDHSLARRGHVNRIGGRHQSGFVMRRTPPRLPPRRPPKIRQCRSERRVDRARSTWDTAVAP